MNMKYRNLVLATAMAGALIACSNEASSDNAAAGQETPAASEAAMMNDPSNPFGTAEMQMHERMMAAVGTNAADTWVRKMIEHHRGAVAMSDVLIAQGGEQRFLDMARKGAEMQRKEITELEGMLSGGIKGAGAANPYGPIESRMHDQMMAAKGGSAAETWARKMIVHHQSAIDMTDTLAREGGNPQVLAIAKRSADMQRKEIRELQDMLAGGSGSAKPQAQAPETPKATPPARSTPAATRDAAPKPAAPKPAAPTAPAADPHAGQDMSTMPKE